MNKTWFLIIIFFIGLFFGIPSFLMVLEGFTIALVSLIPSVSAIIFGIIVWIKYDVVVVHGRKDYLL